MNQRSLSTRRGVLSFPAYIPVTTFGNKYPLDRLVQPYLPRLAPAVMVSYHYATLMEQEQRPQLPLFIDSGGFAALFSGSQIHEKNGLGVLEVHQQDGQKFLHPRDVLEFQEGIADVAFTLDFPIPPNLEMAEAHKRQRLTINNALWALKNRRRRDLPLYACIQAWDVESARECAKAFAGAGFDGIAIGGLVPRCHDLSLVRGIIEIVRDGIGELPLHVFGLGHPQMVRELYRVGVDSVDSSSYVQYAADGKLWANPNLQITDPTPTDRLHLALCNLAMATGKTLPLAMSELVFSTLSTSRTTLLTNENAADSLRNHRHLQTR